MTPRNNGCEQGHALAGPEGESELSDQTTLEIGWGRVLGFLEVGVAFGYWSKKSADGLANALGHRYSVRRVRRLLNRPR